MKDRTREGSETRRRRDCNESGREAVIDELFGKSSRTNLHRSSEAGNGGRLVKPSVTYTFLRYEIKRSVARRKVVVLGFFTLLIGTAPYFLLSYLGGGHSTIMTILGPYFGYLWVVGVFLPQSFFVPFTAILISGGAMSEEYEQGTAELLLSKPVTKADYFAGKFLGGYLLIVFIIALNMILSVISATITFGPQIQLNTLPLVFVAQILRGVTLLCHRIHVRGGGEEIIAILHHLIRSFFHERDFRARPHLDLYSDWIRFLPTGAALPSDFADGISWASRRKVLPPRKGHSTAHLCLFRGSCRDFACFFACSNPALFFFSIRRLFCFL